MGDDSTSIQHRLKALKHELKKYESGFRAKHGRVAEREEIKADATMWAKYREYKSLQRNPPTPAPDRDDARAMPPAREETVVLRDRPTNSVSATPQKDRRTADMLAIPEVEATPACIRHALGPTPQRDGAVLGIFDMLPTDTPSKGHSTMSPALANKVDATPSKPSATSSDPLLSRTPQSSGKRFFLNAYAATPLKRKAADDICTPSTSKRQFATPSFLRRNISLPPIDEESHDAALPTQPFRRRQGLVRSLSTIIQGLKKQEESRMDDDWDIMNEIEAETESGGAPKTTTTTENEASEPTVLVEDSQNVEMPLGPDQSNESSEDDGAGDRGALDANGQPRKVWKKKGLKRQTKRTKMRPVVHKAKKAGDLDDEVTDGDDMGGETGEEDQDKDERHDSQLSNHESAKSGLKKKAIAKESDAGTGKKAKKIGPQDHANFRRLNIKSKNSKPKGRSGRFGRR